MFSFKCQLHSLISLKIRQRQTNSQLQKYFQIDKLKSFYLMTKWFYLFTTFEIGLHFKNLFLFRKYFTKVPVLKHG